MSTATETARESARQGDGKFGEQAHSEPDLALEVTAGEDEYDDFDDDTCHCGASLDDGEGYDGECGNCADATESELFQPSITDADGDDPYYTVHHSPYDDDDETYYVRDENSEEVLEFQYIGDSEDHNEIQAAMLRAFKAKGIELYDEENPRPED